MDYKFLCSSKNSFYPVTMNEMVEVESDLEINIPKDLKELYLEVGYGFIKGSEYNVNRILDPLSVRDFRKRQNDFKFMPDIDIYDEFERDKLIFFEASESALMSIGFGDTGDSAIYYYDIKIASSLKDFLQRIQENDRYYLELV